MNYPEFEGIESMSTEDKAIYLLKLINRYNDVIAQAKTILDEECIRELSTNQIINPNLRIKTRTTSTVDNNMLKTAYPDVYEKLYIEGKLVAKAQDLKDCDDDLLENVISKSVSSWLEYKEKI
jgi:hypothetical protein